MKHYLRGEEGVYYEDLWPLVKFLPAFAYINSPPSPHPGEHSDTDENHATNRSDKDPNTSTLEHNSDPRLPLHNSHGPPHMFLRSPTPQGGLDHPLEEPDIQPSRIPPKFSYHDFFPFCLVQMLLPKRAKEIRKREAAQRKAKMPRGKRGKIVGHNVPLEIALYLVGHFEAQMSF